MTPITIADIRNVLTAVLVAVSPIGGVLVACGLCAILGLPMTDFTSYMIFGACVPATVILAVLGASRPEDIA